MLRDNMMDSTVKSLMSPRYSRVDICFLQSRTEAANFSLPKLNSLRNQGSCCRWSIQRPAMQRILSSVVPRHSATAANTERTDCGEGASGCMKRFLAESSNGHRSEISARFRQSFETGVLW